MKNAHLILEGFRQQVIHPLLFFPLTPAYLKWLSRPCQLPLPFPSLGRQSTYRLLDMAMLDWKSYRLTTKQLCLP